jgi:nucleotide-binding universal stress UspA family protein
MTEPTWMNGAPRHILLATDMSARCDRALDRAASLANAWQATITAVHALEQADNFYTASLERQLPSWRRPPDAARAMEDQLRHDMMQAAERVSAIVERGEPTDVILGVAKAKGCDLIVTGIARDEMLGRFGLGTTVDRLVRRSPIPVLLAKSRVRSDYRHVVVATDLSECSLHALHAATRFFPDQKMSLLHAFRPPMSGITSDAARSEEEHRAVAVADCARFLAGANVPDTRKQGIGLLVEPGHPAQLIHDYVRTRGVDLVVLGTRGRNALVDILLGSTAKDILSSLPCDALVIREPRENAWG